MNHEDVGGIGPAEQVAPIEPAEQAALAESDFATRARDRGEAVVGAVSEKISTGYGSAKEALKSGVDGVKGFLTQKGVELATGAENLKKRLSGFFNRKSLETKQKITEIPAKVSAFASRVGKSMASAGTFAVGAAIEAPIAGAAATSKAVENASLKANELKTRTETTLARTADRVRARSQEYRGRADQLRQQTGSRIKALLDGYNYSIASRAFEKQFGALPDKMADLTDDDIEIKAKASYEDTLAFFQQSRDVARLLLDGSSRKPSNSADMAEAA